jgi:aromatic ring-opening dioxygenase LigB subunit
MGVVFACIAPHGAEIIPELAGDMFDAFTETRKGMEKIGNLATKLKPETVILATPHGLRLLRTLGVVISQFIEGSLEANGKQVRLRCECDRQLALDIIEKAKAASLPIVGANFGTNEGPSSCMPMDWGALIPLWFLVGPNSTKPKATIVTPSRELSLKDLVKFGQVIAETAHDSKKNIAFVASADQGHAHKADGPYGFNVASQKFDEIVKQAVLKNDLKPVFDLPPQFIEDAKPDSPWQMAILQGVLNKVPLKGQLLSYQIPTYYAMLCASYQ